MEIKRDRYLNLLISKKHNGLSKAITGMKRCGKSYLLFNLFKGYLLSEGIEENHIIEITFDAYENSQFPFVFPETEIQNSEWIYSLGDIK